MSYRGDALDNNNYCIAFDYRWDIAQDRIESGKVRQIPSDAVFDSFEKNETQVRERYIQFVDECMSILKNEYGTTLFYESGMSLVADRDFAGISAGENLSDLFSFELGTVSSYGEGKDIFLPLDLGHTYPYMLSYYKFGIVLKRTNLTPVKQTVHFSLSIPIKQVNLLTWFNETITDENALLPISDIVLHCDFTTKYNFVVSGN